jgi:hypothetical protein
MHPHAAEPLDVVTATSSHEHSNAAGLCMICGSAWPCPRTDLDGRDLALLCARLHEQAGSAARDVPAVADRVVHPGRGDGGSP